MIGKTVLCDGCGDTIPDAAQDATDNLAVGYDEGWLDEFIPYARWGFTKVYPEKGKWVPPVWEPSENYLSMISQGGADSFVSSQV